MIEWLFKKLLWNGQCGRSLQRRPKEFALQSTWTCIFQQRLLHFLLVDLSKHIILYTETFIYLLESQNDRKREERERDLTFVLTPQMATAAGAGPGARSFFQVISWLLSQVHWQGTRSRSGAAAT